MHLDIIKVFFIYQLMHNKIALKRILKFTLKQLQHVRCNHHHQGALYSLARSNNALPDGGVCTETFWSSFKVNFNILFKAILLCISW
jgi:hypothetical protein